MLTTEASQWLPDLVFAAIVAAMIVSGLWSSARVALQKRAAEGWPTAEARIETSYVMHNSSNRRRDGRLGFIPVLQYSYTVEGERYSGSAHLGIWESDPVSASRMGQGWAGEKIRVRYKASNPAVSVWLESDGAPASAHSTLPGGSDDSVIDLELNK